MNANDAAIRNRLTIDSLSALLFIKVNGPPPSLFDQISYVEQRLKESMHAVHYKPAHWTSQRPPSNCYSNCNAFLLIHVYIFMCF